MQEGPSRPSLSRIENMKHSLVPRTTLLPALLLGLAAACSTPQGPPIHTIASEVNATLARENVSVIVPGDVLGVRAITLVALEQRDLNIQAPVQEDGMVVLPSLGSVQAAGLTSAQLTERLAEALSQELASGSKVVVNVLTPAPRTVHVIGAVKKSGAYPMPASGRLTLVEAFAEAGGTEYLVSYLGNTMIIRWDAENQRQVSWVVDARPRWWGEAETILLQPNDVIYVPDTPVARVNKWIDRYIVRNIPFPRFIVPAG